MTNTWVCKDCVNRSVGCHDACADYLEQKYEHESVKEAADKERWIRNGANAQMSKACDLLVMKRKRRR